MRSYSVLLLVVVCVHTVSSACKNTVSADNPLEFTVIRADGNQLKMIQAEVTNCRQLVKKYPFQCYNNDVGGENGVCCDKCKAIGPCMDLATKETPVLVNMGFFHGVQEVSSCPKLAKKHPIMCRESAGKQKGLCCESCKTVEVSDCMDDSRTPDSISPEFGERFKNCKWLTKNDKCACSREDIKKHCCKTCANAVLPNCDCWDVYNKKTRPGWTIFVHVKYGDNQLIDRQAIGHCKEIAEWFPFACSSSCCKSCTGVDPECVDNLNWRTDAAKGGNTCKNCNCHEIYRKSRSLMKDVCKNDVKGTNMPSMGAREACCHQCSRVGFDKPEGYEKDPLLENNVSAIA